MPNSADGLTYISRCNRPNVFVGVDHEILLQWHKRHRYPAAGLTFFRCMEGGLKTSGCHKIESGAPQGSVLGPFLFLVFSDDMRLRLKRDTDIYADDTISHAAKKPVKSNST